MSRAGSTVRNQRIIFRIISGGGKREERARLSPITRERRERCGRGITWPLIVYRYRGGWDGGGPEAGIEKKMLLSFVSACWPVNDPVEPRPRCDCGGYINRFEQHDSLSEPPFREECGSDVRGSILRQAVPLASFSLGESSSRPRIE